MTPSPLQPVVSNNQLLQNQSSETNTTISDDTNDRNGDDEKETTITGSSISITTNSNNNNNNNNKNDNNNPTNDNYTMMIMMITSRSIDSILNEITKKVIRCKLNKYRHLVLENIINTSYLDVLFPFMLPLFIPQIVTYNGGIANIQQWKISCYLEVMDGGIPCTEPNLPLLQLFTPLLTTCNTLFLHWYKQQHSCNNNNKTTTSTTTNSNKENNTTTTTTTSNNNNNTKKRTITNCHRLMTFITRYTPQPGEQALLKHIDGAGKVDGSCVVQLPMDRWSAPEEINRYEGGGLTFWDGPNNSNNKNNNNNNPIHYDTQAGDITFIDRAVWHQADPITKGTRWALVIFYKVLYNDHDD